MSVCSQALHDSLPWIPMKQKKETSHTIQLALIVFKRTSDMESWVVCGPIFFLLFVFNCGIEVISCVSMIDVCCSQCPRLCGLRPPRHCVCCAGTRRLVEECARWFTSHYIPPVFLSIASGYTLSSERVPISLRMQWNPCHIKNTQFD